MISFFWLSTLYAGDGLHFLFGSLFCKLLFSSVIVYFVSGANDTVASPSITPSPLSLPIRMIIVLLFVFIDGIIDPVALRGDCWGLGKTYGYAEPGIYFGVPLSNFAEMSCCSYSRSGNRVLASPVGLVRLCLVELGL